MQARNKPADGSGHVTQPRPRTPTHGAKGGPKTPCKSSQKQGTAQQKGQPIKQAPAKVDAVGKKTKKTKKGKHHQHDLIVTIDLVSCSNCAITINSIMFGDQKENTLKQ